ncbi:MAG: 50S ribosomal protein L34e [Candidatus Diapherotrites archaeon]
MVQRKDRYKKKVFKRIPSGKTKASYKEKKHSKHSCALCGKILHGVPHGKSPNEIRKLSKSQRRPQVIFGGVLCSECRTAIVEEAVKEKEKKAGEVDLNLKPYVETMMKRIK